MAAFDDEPDLSDLPLVSFFEPCELFMKRSEVVRSVRQNLANTLRQLDQVDKAHPMYPSIVAAKAQRESFLKWLEQWPDDNVFLAIYPVNTNDLIEPRKDELG